MSLIVSALQPSFAPGLLEVTGNASTNLAETLTEGTGGYYAEYEDAESRWKLNFTDRKPLATALAGECSRLACASFQSFSNVSGDFQHSDSVAWALVKSYYAAFYAGHSLLRALGCTCTYLHGSRLERLRNIFDAYGVSERPSKGLYKTWVAGRGRVLMLATAGNGGTHEGFWKVFNARLKELTDNVLIGSTLPDADAQRVWEQLTSVGDSLTGNGANTSWLSELRNSIQYRQEHGVWFPDKLPNARREILGRIALAWVKPPDEITMATTAGRLGQFLSACTFLVALCRELLVRIDLRCSVGSSFAGFGPLQYLRVRG